MLLMAENGESGWVQAAIRPWATAEAARHNCQLSKNCNGPGGIPFWLLGEALPLNVDIWQTDVRPLL